MFSYDIADMTDFPDKMVKYRIINHLLGIRFFGWEIVEILVFLNLIHNSSKL